MSASSATSSRPSIPAPRRPLATYALASAVAITLCALLLVSARDTVRSAVSVEVTPVVYAPESAEQRPTSGATPPSSANPRPNITIQAPGWLEADPFSVACTALADGVVQQVLVLEGQRVRKGDLVARLVSDDARLSLAQAAAELQAAESRRAIAQADSDAATTDWDHPVERDRAVETSRAALAETEAELAQLPSLIEQQQAMLERMREELARTRQALSSGAATDFELIIQEKNVQAQAAALTATQQRRAILEARLSLLTAESRAAERNAKLRVTERRALDTAAAMLQQADAELARATAMRDEAQLRFDRMTITAPIDGLVQRRLKAPGDKIMLAMDDPASAQILLLYDPAHIQVRVDVPLADAAHIFVGQPCEVVVDVLPDQPFAGEVTRITNEADLQKNTLQVKVRVIDPSPVLRPEMLTRVKFLPTKPGNRGAAERADSPAHQIASLLINQRALTHRKGSAAQVWVIRDRRSTIGVVQQRNVTIQTESDGWALISADLRPGDLLAISDTPLASGDRVRLTETPRRSGGAS